MLYHIVAVAENRVIGKKNRLPWHFSADLKHFKQLTMGMTVIMGRKTFESIGKPLPGRQNFVLSRSLKNEKNPEGPSLKFFVSLDDALKQIATPDAFIIGGAELYRQTIEQIDGIWLTSIPGVFEGDAFYPEIPDSFRENSRQTLQENPRIDSILYLKK
ncbi:MAG: hypothetical protein A2036_01635 [Omnitrophica bacterium GWA2_50_21]|nr:MAG: hypothetical protein A2036_01635 [Omnitrophica bacterium GWA2_50_21]